MNAWTTLGLGRTSDPAEIRRAYARRLKAIDVDADPAAFIALREALQRALMEAARRASPRAPAAPPPDTPAPPAARAISAPSSRAKPAAPAPQPVEPAAPDPQPAAPIAPEPLPPEAAPAPVDAAPPAPPEVESANLRFVLLERLLFPADGAPPADPELLDTAVQAVLHHPEMEGVDHRARVEDWLAQILFHAIPRSDPVIPAVVAHFGWEVERQAVFRRPLVAQVAQRADDLACIARLEKPEHRWHEAWARLRRQAPGTIGFRDRVMFKPQIAQLLDGLRVHFPNVLHQLDADQVARWEREIGRRGHLYRDHRDRIGWYGWLALAWLVLNVASLSVQGMR